MPDYSNRAGAEGDMAAAISGAHEDALRAIRERLGEPPDETKLDDAFWLGIAMIYREALRAPLENVYIDAAVELAAQTGQDIDMSLAASTWASIYSESLAAMMIENRRAFTKDAVQKMKAMDWTMAELLAYLMTLFGAANAASIAVTEVTNAVSEGERQYALLYHLIVGTALTAIVRNEFDPCDICIDKVGHSPYLVGFPGYHPNCRCYVDYISL